MDDAEAVARSAADGAASPEPGAHRWLRTVDRFVPAPIWAEGGERLIRARVLAGTSLIVGAATLVIGVGEALASGGVIATSAANLVGGVFIVAAAPLLLWTGSLALTANLLVAIGWAMTSMLHVMSPGTNVSALYAYAMMPVIGMLIGGLRTGAFWTVVCCVSAVFVIEHPATAFSVPLSLLVVESGRHVARDVITITIWLALVGALFDRIWAVAQSNAESARAQAEESERRFALFFEANPDGIVMADADTGLILECNEGFLQLLGRPRAQVVGRLGWAEALDMTEAQRDAVSKALRESGQTDDIDVAFVNHAEAEVALRARASRVVIEGQSCVLATLRDVTEHSRLEAQLRQAQKMEAVGQLAGSIAHDFNNMLTVISGYAEHLTDALDDEHEQMAREIHGAAERSADLTRQLLAFSRRQVLEPQVLGLNEMIVRLETLLERLIGEPIAIVLDLAPDLGSVRADPGQLEQVIVNLAINARDAMPDGGTLRVETARFRGTLPGDGEDDDWVRLRVSDTGHGMDEATLERVFEPFFTTKEPGKGTGLGLSTVQGIVRQSGGELALRSRPGEGTMVEIYFPRLSEAGARVAPARDGAARSDAAAPEQTILLVEDDDMVRRLASRTLRAGGYEVIEASDGDEALEVFLDRSDAVDLVLTDMVMPQRGGLELARRIREIRPDVPLIFMSGYPNPREDAGMVIPEGEELLQKPFSPGSLRARVGDVLARGEGGD